MKKITIANHFRVLSFHLMGTCMMIICLWWLSFDKIAATVFLIFWLIYTVPALFLHVTYYIRNKNLGYEISDNELIVENNGIVTKFSYSDIKEINFYMSQSLYKGSSLRFLAIESYYFARIITKENKEIEITCLVDPGLQKTFEHLRGFAISREIRFICTLSSR